MNHAEYEIAINQLTAAAQLVAAGLPEAQRLDALTMLAFFRLRQGRLRDHGVCPTSNDELFRQTASAALALAGRAELLAAAALLEQARTLLRK